MIQKMFQNQLVMSLVVLTVALSWACGGSTVEIDNRPEDETQDYDEIDPQLRAFAEEVRRAECQVLFGCCDAQERIERLGISYSEDECLTNAGLLPSGLGLAMLNEAIVSERIVVDWDAADMCINAFTTQSCGEFTEREAIRTTLPGCRQMLIPQSENGEECILDEECISGYCHRNVFDEDAVDLCADMSGVGDDCSASTCPSGTFCDSIDYTCRQTLRAGSSCYRAQDCRSNRCEPNDQGELRCTEIAPICVNG
ncbi:hypothetical protein DV096_09555 [Bradymonadaceae bacterium TMQ3]|uniref:Dickkopf N-terminal cysteine-rich domain-containing protein n=1 Tax=Lujinxingia sediminis TaxID=2480984 RepID=A0ABY0CP95_9DELT|nr:hypothetical protein [Lujinxingia sediminis]RDV38051.1 hypothetical protein DV096_09555 [Bradymonadaceae bacterium TMQ3]RVU42279.1 hypothetical protein EA187_16975 [Lujinxingia sediminis]TXC75722.1 hypothetical protein FRC91_09460 [Bradymonadales bacterium TMQ1]